MQAVVETTDGEELNVEIRFEVMDVKRTLISTSSLKRKGVTTTFGKDRDMLTIGDRHIELKSIGDHSFLRLWIKDDVSTEFLVMTGEVDE